MKRYRQKKCKPGQLLLYWGKLPHDNPDIVGAWGGEGADKRDSHLIMSTFCSPRVTLVFNEEDKRKAHGRPYYFDHSLMDELKQRGYDISTLKFSIEQLPKP